MPLSKPGPSADVVQGTTSRLGQFWQYWLDKLLLELYQSLSPPGAIVIVDPNVVDITTEFPTVAGPTNGIGRVGGPYQWWALCNGNNNTPDLSTASIEATFGLRYIMRLE